MRTESNDCACVFRAVQQDENIEPMFVLAIFVRWVSPVGLCTFSKYWQLDKKLVDIFHSE